MDNSTFQNGTDNEVNGAHGWPLGVGIFLAMLTISLGFIIIAGNSVMLVLIWKNSRDLLGSEVTTFLLLNVTLTDLLVGISNITVNVLFSLATANNFDHYLHDFPLCVIAFGVNLITVGTSSCFLLIVTADRYMNIVHPFRHLRWSTMHRVYIVVGLTWTFITLTAFVPSVWNKWDAEVGCKGIFLLALPYAAVGTIMDLIILCTMVVLNINVYYVARTHARRIEDQMSIGSSNTSSHHVVNNKGRKAATSIGIVIVAYVLCSMPLMLNYLAVILCKLIGLDSTTGSNATLFTLLIRICNSAINPIIFQLTIPSVRNASRKLFANVHC